MKKEFQTYLKLWRPPASEFTDTPKKEGRTTTAPEAGFADFSSQYRGPEAPALNTLNEQLASLFGLPVGQKVKVTLKGAPSPEINGTLTLRDNLLLADGADRNPQLLIGVASVDLKDIESCLRI
jgi:hypothetical protein